MSDPGELQGSQMSCKLRNAPKYHTSRYVCVTSDSEYVILIYDRIPIMLIMLQLYSFICSLCYIWAQADPFQRLRPQEGLITLGEAAKEVRPNAMDVAVQPLLVANPSFLPVFLHFSSRNVALSRSRMA